MTRFRSRLNARLSCVFRVGLYRVVSGYSWPEIPEKVRRLTLSDFDTNSVARLIDCAEQDMLRSALLHRE